MVDGQKRFCICREYFVSQVWRFFEEEDLFLFEICLIGKLSSWDIMVNLWQQQNLSAPEGWFGVWIDWKKMFHLFISSLQIIRMTIRPRHNSWGVMSAITRRISPLGQNRDKTRLQMRDTVHREDTSLSSSGRKIDIISLIMILWKQKTPCIKVDLFHHNVQF